MKSKKIKNALYAVLSLALVSAAAVAVTWAYNYSSADTGSQTNTFTNSNDIDTNAFESWWDYKDKKEEGGSTVPNNFPTRTTITLDDGTTTPAAVLGITETKGETLAQRYMPGMYIPKNPAMHNKKDKDVSDGNKYAEYVAMTVSYKLLVPKTEGYYTGTASSANAGKQKWSTAVTGTGDQNNVDTDTIYANYYVFDMSYTNFTGQLAKIYTAKTVSGTPVSVTANDVAENKFNVDDTDANKWTQLTAGTEYMYNNVVYANGNDNDVSSTLFDYVKINDAIETVDGVEHDVTGAAVTQKYKFTVNFNDGSSITSKDIYVDNLPGFRIDLQGFAVDANLDEYKNSAKTNILSLVDTNNTGGANAKAALQALIAQSKKTTA